MARSFRFVAHEAVANFQHYRPVTDVYCMGATCYWALTGKGPLERKPGQEDLDMIVNNTPIPIHQREPYLPLAVAQVIDRSLQPITDRYQDGQQLYAAFAQALQQEGI